MRTDRIEWDDAKARLNLAKHRVSFETAMAVFEDPYGLIQADDEAAEERWQTIGLAHSKLLCVIWTERHGTVIRIISARKANRKEQDRYVRQARS